MNTTAKLTVRQAIHAAMLGHAAPSFRDEAASNLLAQISALLTTSNVHDLAELGSFTLKMLVERGMQSATAERESVLLVDQLRRM